MSINQQQSDCCMMDGDGHPDGDGRPDGDGHHDGGDDGFVRRNDVEKMREMQLSIAASSSVFPGFRFSPTDDELISYYLKKKLQGNDSCVDIIPEVDFCRHEPWDLPALSIIQSENEWFFFSTRGKKYPNGSQSKRATQSGYWKATGKERNVKTGGVTIGTKRTLVFHTGRAPRGERTEWIMHEYCMGDTSQESLVVCRLRRNGDFRLTESSRGSNDLRNSSTTDNGNSGANENVNIQRDGSDDGIPMKSWSKDSTSSYMSHSVEQNESESDSDKQLILHESTHGSSSPYKDCKNEDDCFADIINDDIITLDESASHSLTFHGLPVGSKCMQPQESMAAQGTALRRIKLRQQMGQKHEKQSDGVQNQPSEKKPGCVVSTMAGEANTVYPFHPAHLVLIFLFLLIIYVLKCAYFKQPMGINMEVLKKQLRDWLHKAADYI